MEEVAREYKKLQGMELTFVRGVLEERLDEAAGYMIGYTVTFRLSLDFTHFVQRANAYIPGYLDSRINAIRPVLGGLGYHNGYNYFNGQAGNIRSTEDLFRVFDHASNYLDDWAEGDLRERYHKPKFELVKGQFEVTAGKDFQLREKRQIEISDLPIIQFEWALDLMVGHDFQADSQQPRVSEGARSPGSVAVLGYAQEESVPVEGLLMRRGTQYMNAKKLSYGAISPEQILTAQ